MSNNTARKMAITDMVLDFSHLNHKTGAPNKNVEVWFFNPTNLIRKEHTILNRLLGLQSVNHFGNEKGKK